MTPNGRTKMERDDLGPEHASRGAEECREPVLRHGHNVLASRAMYDICVLAVWRSFRARRLWIPSHWRYPRNLDDRVQSSNSRS